MKDYSKRQVTTVRHEYRMVTPADWVDVDKMWHHAAHAWRQLKGLDNLQPDYVPSAEALQYSTHDEYVVISFEVSTEERLS